MVKKKPCIPSIYRSVKLVSDIKKKCDLFNSYFEEQCTAVVNDSKLPSVLTVHTESLLESFYFSADHIRDIKKLDPNKAHGYDMMSIRMLKLSVDSVWKPLEIIFKNCLKEGIFPDEWKKANRSTKKIINKSYLIIDQFPFFQFVVRYLNV